MEQWGSSWEGVVAAMKRMAILRQADAGNATYAAYVVALRHEQQAPDVVTEACDRIAVQRRGDGETAFPSLGDLLLECQRVRIAREDQRRAALAASAPPYFFEPPARPDMTPDEARAFVSRLRADAQAARRRSVEG